MSRSAKDINELIPWQEISPGGEICEGGTARLVKTGQWRSDVPVWEEEKCKQCLLEGMSLPGHSHGKGGAVNEHSGAPQRQRGHCLGHAPD